MKTLRSRLLAKDVLVGTFSAIAHPAVTEMVAGAGFDFMVIDAEHSQISRENLEDLFRAAEVGGTPAILRVPDNNRVWIGSALDAGAAGVLVPRVSGAADARAAVAATRYPPQGERGVGPGRAAAYGAKIEEAIAGANAKVILAVQLETAEGLACVDEIAAVDGIDAIYIGPGDLAVSLGALGPEGRPALDRAIRTVVDSCKRHGRAVGIFNMTAESLAAAIGQGMTFVTLSSDSMFLSRGLKEAADAARKARG